LYFFFVLNRQILDYEPILTIYSAKADNERKVKYVELNITSTTESVLSMDDSPVNKCLLTGMLDWKLMVKHIYNVLQVLKTSRQITTIMAVAYTECTYTGVVSVQLGFSSSLAQVQILCEQRNLGREKTGSSFRYAV